MAKRLSRHRGTTPRIGLPVALTLLLLVLLAAVFAKPALVIADETAPEEIEATAPSDNQPNEESTDNVQLDLDETSVDAEETALDETATNEEADVPADDSEDSADSAQVDSEAVPLGAGETIRLANNSPKTVDIPLSEGESIDATFTVSKNSMVLIGITCGENSSGTITLKSSGNEINSWHFGAGNYMHGNYLLAPGDYTFTVESDGAATRVTALFFMATDIPDTYKIIEVEPNYISTNATPLQFGKRVIGSICYDLGGYTPVMPFNPAADYDCYKFTLSSAKKVTLTVVALCADYSEGSFMVELHYAGGRIASELLV